MLHAAQFGIQRATLKSWESYTRTRLRAVLAENRKIYDYGHSAHALNITHDLPPDSAHPGLTISN